jgi:AraC-like DNA-binding protein
MIVPGAVFVHGISAHRAVLSREQWRSQGMMKGNTVNVVAKGDSWIILGGMKYRLRTGDALFMINDTVYERDFASSTESIDVMWMYFDAHFSTHLSLFKLYPPPACLTGGAARTIRRLIGSAIREWRSTDTAREIRLGSLSLEVLATAYRAPRNEVLRPQLISPRQAACPPDNLAPVRRAIEFIGSHFSEPLTFGQVLAQTAYSSGYFCRLFHRLTGLSPMQYLEHVRIQESQRLLLNTAASIRAVAEQVGFPDPYHYSRVFRRVQGMSPALFRKRIASG